MGNDCNCYKGGDSGNFNLKDKWDDITHPNETKEKKLLEKLVKWQMILKIKQLMLIKKLKIKSLHKIYK